MAKRPMRNRVIRVPDGIWNAAKRAAADRDETVSDAIRRYLTWYGRDYRKPTNN